MVPPLSLRIPRARRYSGYCRLRSGFTYMILTFSDRPSHAVRLPLLLACAVLTPAVFLLPVWPLPLSLAATYRISFDFFSSAYLDVSVRQVPRIHLCIQCTLSEVCSEGFPHSDSCGSRLICSSPQLFAAYRVLHRLPLPRHSPCALFSLNFMSLANRLSIVSFATLNCSIFYHFDLSE